MMTDYLILMHNDSAGETSPQDWTDYLAKLRELGVFQGGSAIGSGACLRRDDPIPSITTHLAGFIRIKARNLDHVRELLIGNPVYDAGGTIEVRELPKTG